MADRSSPFGFSKYVGPVPGGGIDMTPDGRTASDAELVRNNMLARCLADTIPMVNAPGGRIAFGKDVRSWVGAPLGNADAKAAELVIAWGRDPRLQPGSITASITAQPSGAQYALIIRGAGTLTTGRPIAFVLGVSAVTVDLLASEGTP